MDNKIYNLDDGVIEYFEFSIFGHDYRFRQPNTEEINQLQALKDSPEGGSDVLYSFISKIKEESPEFSELSKKMTVPHWKKFNEMIGVEMGIAK